MLYQKVYTTLKLNIINLKIIIIASSPWHFDSTGNIAPRSHRFINKLYAPSSGDNGTGVQRNWNSKIQRRFLKKNFLDSIPL